LNVTRLGSLTLLVPATLLITLVLARLKKRPEAALLATALGITTLATHVFKRLWQRPRPQADHLLLPMPADWSFPSAHTAQATAFFLALAIIVSSGLAPRRAVLVWFGCGMAAFAIGYSRLYLQVHALEDVLGGALLAILITAATAACCRPHSSRRQRAGHPPGDTHPGA
jgi:undecaprenyl-diphosphatase